MSTSLPRFKEPNPQVALTETAVGPAPKRNPRFEDFNFRAGLPTAEELPDSDDKPVDSELQELIPGLLKIMLADLWRDRSDWLFSIDMGFHYDPNQPHIAPDGLLSLGVAEAEDENLRSSYVLWEEEVIPIFALEVVSKTYGQEHTAKLEIYQSIGILYYLVYAPYRKRKAKFQLYKLIDGVYELQSDGQEPYWMPEIGLGIGVEWGTYLHRDRNWLYWYSPDGLRYPTPLERAEAEAVARRAADQKAEAEAVARRAADQKAEMEAVARKAADQKAEAAEEKADRLSAHLRQLGIDPDIILADRPESID